MSKLIKDKTQYLLTLGDGDGIADANIVVGGKTKKFIPNINLSKWDDEAWLNLNHSAINITNEKETFSHGKVELHIQNHILRFYVTNRETLEYEIEFKTKPLINTIQLELDFPDGLRFCYQPPLTQEEINEGISRPYNVVGSYAVYWNKRNNQYKTGKFCHIYRPKLIDADGKQIWAELHIDEIAKLLTITMDTKWLSEAKYPVILDPDLGTKTVGGTWYTLTGAYTWAFKVGTMTEDGTLDSVSICDGHTAPSTTNAHMGVYKGAPGALIVDCGEVSYNPAEDTFATENCGSEQLDTNDVLWAALHVETTNKWDIVYDSDSLSLAYDNRAYAALLATFVIEYTKSSRNYSAYITYTQAGAAAFELLIGAGGMDGGYLGGSLNPMTG